MKLALLGCDDEALALVRAALAAGHSLVAAYDVGRFRQELGRLAQLPPDDEWESLLLGTVADAVIVARGKLDPATDTGFSGDERRADQLRKLVQAAVPLLVVHPACEMIVAYELEMIRADVGGVLQPFVPGLYHPALGEIASLLEGESPLGPIEQLSFQRKMADRSRGAVLAQFSRDVALFRRLLGTIQQIAASGPGGGEYHDPLGPRVRTLPSLVALSVMVSGRAPCSARWSVEPADEAAGATLTMIASRGRAALGIPANPESLWELELTAGHERQKWTFEPHDAAADALARLQTAIGRLENRDSAWLDACRDLEAASAIDRSLDKGRAVALYTDEISQEQSFKGVMAVGGCLMLAVTLVGLLFVVMVEALQLEFRRAAIWRLWPVYLLAPILIFLLLQLLQSVAKKKSAAGQPSARELAAEEAQQAS